MCHGQLKRHSGVLSGLVPRPMVLLKHNFVVYCSKAGRRVVAGALRRREQLLEDETIVGSSTGSWKT